jgi:hypothetical protein
VKAAFGNTYLEGDSSVGISRGRKAYDNPHRVSMILMEAKRAKMSKRGKKSSIFAFFVPFCSFCFHPLFKGWAL